MLDKATTAVITTIQQYRADNHQAGTHGYLDIECIQADAHSQFTADQFCEHCRQSGIHLVLAAPKKQYKNHLAEHSWQTVSTMGRSMLVQAWLPDTFMYHALVYATYIFNILPVRGLLDDQEIPSTPHQLFFGYKPSISNCVVFGCPTIICWWGTTGKTEGKQTEWGIHGIFIGFAMNQKGNTVFSPASRKFLIMDDVIFDESFSAAIATTWQQHQDSLALQSVTSFIPDVTTCLECTGTVADTPTFSSPQVGEWGDPNDQNMPDLCDANDNDSDSESDDDDNDDASEASDSYDFLVPPPQLTFLKVAEPEIETPMVLDDGTTLHHSNHIRNPNPKYASMAQTVNWFDEDMELAKAPVWWRHTLSPCQPLPMLYLGNQLPKQSMISWSCQKARSATEFWSQ